MHLHYGARPEATMVAARCMSVTYCLKQALSEASIVVRLAPFRDLSGYPGIVIDDCA